MAEPKKLLSLRIVASDEASSIFLIAGVLLNQSKNSVDGVDAIAVPNPQAVKIPLRATFKDYTNKCEKLRKKGDFLKNLTSNLIEGLKREMANESFQEELFFYFENKNILKAQEMIRFIIAKSTGPAAGLKVDLSMDKISTQEIDITTLVEEQEPKPQAPTPEPVDPLQVVLPGAQESGIPASSNPVDPSNYIPYQFILSPVTGKAVSELQPGNPVYVKIDPSSTQALQFIQEAGLKNEDGTLKQYQAFVQSITNTGNQSEVIVRLRDNLYGRYLEEENTVRVKVQEIDRTQNLKNQPQNINRVKEESSVFLMAVIAIGLLAFLSVILLFLI